MWIFRKLFPFDLNFFRLLSCLHLFCLAHLQLLNQLSLISISYSFAGPYHVDHMIVWFIRYEPYIDTILWDLETLECALLVVWNFGTRGIYIPGLRWANQIFEEMTTRWPNWRFYGIKFKNRLVNHLLSPNSTFLFHFWKARGILS